MDVGFIGLGQMGRPMALRLLEAGHRVTAWNRTPRAVDALAARGAIVTTDAAGAVDADVVVTMLADDAAVEATWFAGGLVTRMRPGAVHANMASTSVALAGKLAAAHAAAGGRYVSAPVFGRPAVAAQGQLDVIAAGEATALAAVEPLFRAMAKQIFVVGDDPGRANAVKIARNFLISTLLESLGEAFAITERCGVPRATFLEILSNSSLGSPALRSYGKLMVDRAYEPAAFTMKLGLKDVDLALATAAEVDLPLPSGEVVRRNFLDAIAQGDGERDWAAIAERIGAATNSGGPGAGCAPRG